MVSIVTTDGQICGTSIIPISELIDRINNASGKWYINCFYNGYSYSSAFSVVLEFTSSKISIYQYMLGGAKIKYYYR